MLLHLGLIALCVAQATSVVCNAGQYFRKYGPACGQDCCECVPGNWCPGSVDGYEKSESRCRPLRQPWGEPHP